MINDTFVLSSQLPQRILRASLSHKTLKKRWCKENIVVMFYFFLVYLLTDCDSLILNKAPLEPLWER